tara:strand:- start:87 stop:353 length:267 start_codon:yes stop_codon:yes gene_type:complete
MGIGGISIWQILIILLVILVLFGGKKIRNMGSDLGEGLRALKKQSKMRIRNQNQSLIQKKNNLVSNRSARNSNHIVGWNIGYWSRTAT